MHHVERAHDDSRIMFRVEGKSIESHRVWQAGRTKLRYSKPVLTLDLPSEERGLRTEDVIERVKTKTYAWFFKESEAHAHVLRQEIEQVEQDAKELVEAQTALTELTSIARRRSDKIKQLRAEGK